MTNKIGVWLGVVLAVSGIAGFYFFSEQAILWRILILLFGLSAAMAVFWLTPQGKQLMVFVGEAAEEARKVVWPTRRETIQTTLVVVVMVAVVATFLAFVDVGFAFVVQKLMGRGQ